MVLMNLFAGQQWKRRHREQTYGHKDAGRKEKVRQMETSMEPQTNICKIESQWECAV